MSKAITIQEDKRRIQELDRLSTAYVFEFNKLLADLKKVYPIKSKGDFMICFKDVRQALTNKAISELTIPLEGLKKEVLETMVKLPEELESLLMQISSIKNKKKSGDILNILDYNGSEFEINQNRLETLKDYHRIKIHNTEQKERAKKLGKLADMVNELNLVNGGNLASMLRVLMIQEGKVIAKPHSVINGY